MSDTIAVEIVDTSSNLMSQVSGSIFSDLELSLVEILK